MNLFLADDHATFRESLRIALATRGPFSIVGEAAAARALYEGVEKLRPDVLVCDLLLEDTDAVSVVRELKRRRLRVQTLVLTRVSHPAFVEDALASGAAGYALKDDSLADIIGAIETVQGGQRYVSTRVVPAKDANTNLSALSVREREVFCRLLEGWSTKDIARSLCISAKTVEAHRFRINRKLGVRSPTQLLHYAAGQGLVV